MPNIKKFNDKKESTNENQEKLPIHFSLKNYNKISLKKKKVS